MGRKSGLNLGGQWSGEYSYPRRAGPKTPFLATIEDQGGRLSGSIIEPDMLGSGSTLEASIVGLRHGASVDFTKLYRAGSPPGYENPVDYVGRLSSDGNRVTGVWSVLDLDGTFEMRREEALEEVEEAETLALPTPVALS